MCLTWRTVTRRKRRRLRVASEVAELDRKLASVAAEVPRSFYDGGIEKDMATYVDVNAPLATGE